MQKINPIIFEILVTKNQMNGNQGHHIDWFVACLIHTIKYFIIIVFFLNYSCA